MKYVLKFTKTALDDLDKHKKSGDQVIIKKINLLLNELLEHPRIGTGQPEMLKHDLQGIYPRRINK